MLILGIETSCDDTSVAIVENGTNILANITANQNIYHHKFGGIVPEIAARKHLEHILPVLHFALEKADVDMHSINAIGVTYRPGLIGSLLIGLTAAKALALFYKKPLIGIHHIEAHAYAACFSGLSYGSRHLSLVVSGGHTSLLDMQKGGGFRLIGHSVDDAAGEAFDKIAKYLGYGYPGGPIIEKHAKKFPNPKIKFPLPMIDHPNFNFSFSGLKTAVIYYLKKHPEANYPEIASAFQTAVIEVLISKTIKAAQKFNHKVISLVGGVAANSTLREALTAICQKNNYQLFIPDKQYCTDNAAMVAGLAFQKMKKFMLSSMFLKAYSTSGMKLINL